MTNSAGSKANESLWEPFEAIKTMLDLKNLSAEKIDAINESLIADLVGDQPVPPPISTRAPEAIRFYYAIIHLYSSVGRFDVYKKMFSHYPWRGRITKAEHLQCSYHLYAHECYILEERLKGYFNAAAKYGKLRQLDFDIKPISKEVLKTYQKAFGKLIRWRGQHVHQHDFVPRDLERIGLLELMLRGGKTQKAESPGLAAIWVTLQKAAMRESRKRWVESCDSAEKASHQLIGHVFSTTQPVWRRLAEEGTD